MNNIYKTNMEKIEIAKAQKPKMNSRLGVSYFKNPESKRAFAYSTPSDSDFLNSLALEGATLGDVLREYTYFSDELCYIFSKWLEWGYESKSIKGILEFAD